MPELPQDLVIAFRDRALVATAAQQITDWRLLFCVANPSAEQIQQALLAFVAAAERAASAARELDQVGIAGELRRQAERWRNEGLRLAELARGLLPSQRN